MSAVRDSISEEEQFFDEPFADGLEGDGRNDDLGGLVRDEDEVEGRPVVVVQQGRKEYL